MSDTLQAPDLTQRPPRSPRQRLGGFVILPRVLDKGRASLAGTAGEYNYACPLDKRFLDFVKIDPQALIKQLQTGKGDWEILAWIKENAAYKPNPWEIAQWSAWAESLAYGDIAGRERVVKALTQINKDRTDIVTGFDLLDLDDYASFGGKA